MADITDVEGQLVALTSDAYNSFKTNDGESMPAGVTQRAFVVQSFGAAPVEVRVPVDQVRAWVELEAAGFAADVKLRCELRVSGGKIQRKLLEAVVG